MSRLGKFFAIAMALMVLTTPVLAQSGIYIRPDSTSLPAPVNNQTWLFSSSTGQIYVYNSATTSFTQISPPHSNFSATVAPTVSNDQTQGYAYGSLWLNTSSTSIYQCVNPATGAAVWLLLASSSINAAIIPSLLKTSLGFEDFFDKAVIPAIPGSGFTATLPAATGYVGGVMTSTPGGSYTYTANSWTYDFVDNTGLIYHYAQSPSTTPPTPSGQLLLYLVETNGSAITTIVPYYATPHALRHFMIIPPAVNGKVLQSDTTNPLGQSYQFLSPSALGGGGGTTGNTLQYNGSSWLVQTLDPTGGGTGSATLPTNGQIPIGNTSTNIYSPATITPGADITITNGAGSITVSSAAATTPTVAPAAGAGTGATATKVGNDYAGVLTLTTGTSNTTSSIQVTLTQSASVSGGPKAVTLEPANAAAAGISGAAQVFAAPTTTGFTITSGTTALSATTAYAWNYVIHN